MERRDEQCLSQLIPLVEGELRQIAHRYMRMERPGHTLQTTALVNEAYLKLMNHAQVDWQNRAHFLGIAEQLMRHILVDHARGLCRKKRGGGAQHLPLDEDLVFSPLCPVRCDVIVRGRLRISAPGRRVVRADHREAEAAAGLNSICILCIPETGLFAVRGKTDIKPVKVVLKRKGSGLRPVKPYIRLSVTSKRRSFGDTRVVDPAPATPCSAAVTSRMREGSAGFVTSSTLNTRAATSSVRVRPHVYW